MNFKNILYPKDRVHFFTIKRKNVLKLLFINDYTLASQSQSEEIFSYKSLEEDLFQENDEILALSHGKKIILFKNFTQNTNNFKSFLLSQFILLMFLFVASLFFLFVVLNSFSFFDLFFLLVCLMLFSISFINLSILIKHICLLKKFDKEKAKNLRNEK
ncbi:hypothetical protein OQH60_02455 [Campylobacter sp. MIT 21-1685]|uniref:hypothetical protein n=1 Tax=unclassified Campylobacter TaxID=2593542 RepID=UPI00224AB1AA|nr:MULTISPECIES: hypothetical protein [unclassified Campylobacter]MCX2682576.1 hypothetical protein [Campylobacter sp. MIT 21-1684]MCX2750856.1 hypothetical protein [Campylobacter sp. MIT 21-1682]MCX2807211.1 hypothetical protein [Campylobacter sp. MIT 21-1685]